MRHDPALDHRHRGGRRSPVRSQMPTATMNHEAITQRVIEAIEQGQTPPWRPDLDNSGFPTHPATLKPYQGVDVLLANLAANERRMHSKFWATEQEWLDLDARVSGTPTILGDGTPVFNGDQLIPSLGSVAYRSRRRKPVAVDYDPAEAVIQGSGADIRHRLGMEAAYYFPPADYIVFPLRSQFENGPGGLPGYYDSLFHELAHWTEPRLGWNGLNHIRELRSEIAAPFLVSQLGLPVLCDMHKIRNHGKHLHRWIKGMRDYPTLIFNVADAASEAVAFLLSSAKAGLA